MFVASFYLRAICMYVVWGGTLVGKKKDLVERLEAALNDE
jgi:hypothetical protein